jgi:hypothetical protein
VNWEPNYATHRFVIGSPTLPPTPGSDQDLPDYGCGHLHRRTYACRIQVCSVTTRRPARYVDVPVLVLEMAIKIARAMRAITLRTVLTVAQVPALLEVLRA